MQEAYNQLERTAEPYDFKRGAVTADNFSEAMYLSVLEIRNLLDVEGKELSKLQFGYDLVNELRDKSMYDLDMCVSYGDRQSDDAVNDLLVEIIERRAAAGDKWDWEKDLKGTAGRVSEFWGVRD